MNRKVYEAVFFSLRSKESKLQSEIEGLFKTETPQPDVCERVESLLRTLVETEGALHTLKEKYELLYTSPPQDEVQAARWSQLEFKLSSIENHLDPDWTPPEPLTSEDLLQRSPTYRESQGLSPEPYEPVDVEECDDDEYDYEDDDENYREEGEE
jgi:hypothetical protein